MGCKFSIRGECSIATPRGGIYAKCSGTDHEKKQCPFWSNQGE